MDRVASGFAMLVLAAGLAGAQDPVPQPEDARLQALEDRHREILERLSASEERNRRLAEEVEALRGKESIREAEEQDRALESSVNGLAARMRDGITYKDLVRSGMPIKFYGFLRTDLYWQSARMNSIILPQFVLPENNVAAEDSDDHEFAMDIRLNRFAFDIDAGTIGSAAVTGKLETDFANIPSSGVESRPTPRIRLAYVNMDFGEVTIRVGQDWDVIAPLFPAVNGETLMWNAGNLGDRRPMAQFILDTGDPQGTEFQIKAALGLTGAVDGLDLDAGAGVMRPFTSTTLDGFDSGHPHGQLRLGLAFPSWVEGKRARLGAWGYIAGLESDTKFAGEDEFTAWALGADFDLPLLGSLGLRGEVFMGQALADVRGGIAQSVNTATGKEIDTLGGWLELVWQVTDSFRLSAGGTLDNVDGDDIGSGGRDLNWSIYLASLMNWGGGLLSGLDVIFWETQWKDVGIGNTIRANVYVQLNF
jgi:hypothetical protein